MRSSGHSLLARSGGALLAIALASSVGAGASLASSPALPSAITGAVTSVLPTSVVVNGTVDPNGSATSWHFDYSLATSTSYGMETAAKSAGASKSNVSVSATLTGLAPATSYRYRVVATNKAGWTIGAGGIFNTSAAPAVITGAASHLTAASATLNAIVNPEGLASSWWFDYGTSTSYGMKTPAMSLAASPSGTNVTALVSGLAPQTTYHFRIVAASTAGTTIGADLSLTTGLSVSLNAAATAVIHGAFVRLSGLVTSGQSGDQVTIMSESFNETAFSAIASVTTGGGGAWSYSAQPTVRTTYEATADSGTSSPIVVSVSPAVYLSVSQTDHLFTRVVGPMSFAGHVLQLQRLSNGLWVTWKHVLLGAGGEATFITSLPPGRTFIRMAIGPFVVGINQAGPGLLAGYSAALSYYSQ